MDRRFASPSHLEPETGTAPEGDSKRGPCSHKGWRQRGAQAFGFHGGALAVGFGPAVVAT